MPTKMNGRNMTTHGIKNPGEFAFAEWEQDASSPTGFSPMSIEFINPACKFSSCYVRITRGPANESQHRWHWDGNMEAPTLTPSIGCDKRCGWHGSITNGEIIP